MQQMGMDDPCACLSWWWMIAFLQITMRTVVKGCFTTERISRHKLRKIAYGQYI